MIPTELLHSPKPGAICINGYWVEPGDPDYEDYRKRLIRANPKCAELLAQDPAAQTARKRAQ